MLKLHDFCNRALAADPMPPNISDTFIIIKPRDEWPDSGLSKSDLVAKVEKTLESLPGGAFEITQPIQMRFNELIAGVRGDIAEIGSASCRGRVCQSGSLSGVDVSLKKKQ